MPFVCVLPVLALWPDLVRLYVLAENCWPAVVCGVCVMCGLRFVHLEQRCIRTSQSEERHHEDGGRAEHACCGCGGEKWLCGEGCVGGWVGFGHGGEEWDLWVGLAV